MEAWMSTARSTEVAREAAGQSEELLSFFKALADATRLKIVGLLAREALTVEQMAAMLDLSSSTVSHHISRLAAAGLVTGRAEGYYSVFELNAKVVENVARRLLARETLPAVAAGVDTDAFDNKVWRDYGTPDGRLKQIPSQQKKLLAILRRLAQLFEPGNRYTEKQVNEMLARYNEDTATLRRELVDFHMLARANGEYWRTEE
jgi:DNA-binding transcriptional ArsR family regulator